VKWHLVAAAALAMLPAASAGLAAMGGGSDDAERNRRILETLERGDSAAVRELPGNERAILKAAIALKSGQPEVAAASLSGDWVKADPLAALLVAEAYRQQAVQAVASAGDYARNLQGERSRLEEADLTPGLREAEAKLDAMIDRIDGASDLPRDILALGSNVRSYFLVDKARSRLIVFERDGKGQFRRVADEYVVTGAGSGDKLREGDGRTPNGIYRFKSKSSDPALADRYGPVVVPTDYPNDLDLLHGKNGHGIWMHGFQSGVDRRPPQDTKGCFALPNDRLPTVAAHAYPGQSLVLVGEELAFDGGGARQALLAGVQQMVEQWRQDWQSLDSEAYLRHYHPQFRSGGRDLAAWSRYKRQVNSSKEYAKVGLRDFTIVHDPNRWPEGEVVLVEFEQQYESDNFRDRGRKRLLLARSDAVSPWRILIEREIGQ